MKAVAWHYSLKTNSYHIRFKFDIQLHTTTTTNAFSVLP